MASDDSSLEDIQECLRNIDTLQSKLSCSCDKFVAIHSENTVTSTFRTNLMKERSNKLEEENKKLVEEKNVEKVLKENILSKVENYKTALEEEKMEKESILSEVENYKTALEEEKMEKESILSEVEYYKTALEEEKMENENMKKLYDKEKNKVDKLKKGDKSKNVWTVLFATALVVSLLKKVAN